MRRGPLEDTQARMLLHTYHAIALLTHSYFACPIRTQRLLMHTAGALTRHESIRMCECLCACEHLRRTSLPLGRVPATRASRCQQRLRLLTRSRACSCAWTARRSRSLIRRCGCTVGPSRSQT